MEAETPKEKVYEYRKGLLVPMIIVENRLLPEVAGAIIEFKDYEYSPTARRIYNLPGAFVLKDSQKPQPASEPSSKPATTVIAPEKTDLQVVPPGDQDYEFIGHEESTVMHRVGGLSCHGTIDKYGSFKPNLDDLEDAIKKFGTNARTLRPGATPPQLISTRTPNEKVFEYRTGILIPMIIDMNRGLIPELGGTIIDFKDYVYSPTARRIYNLPGRFVPKVQPNK
ncbi:MAG: hypothetical protein QM703_27475 [Gemmatales bacterium]